MRFRVSLTDEAKQQRAELAPDPKRRVRALLRALEDNPYGPDTLQMRADVLRFRVREDGYRIIFEPGPGVREITVTRIALREVAYEGLEYAPPED